MAIDLTVVIDDKKAVNQFRRLRKEAADAVSGMSKEFDKMDSAVDDFAENIELSKKYIEELKRKYQEVSAALSKAPLGSKERAVLGMELRNINNELKAEEKAIRDAETALKSQERTYASLESEMKDVKNEMAQLEMAGQRNSTRYKELEDRLGQLATAHKKVQLEQKKLSTGATQWAGIQSGLQGVLGAFAAGQGIIGAFTSDTEKLVKIQTRLQSIMGIIMGMTQVSKTLHETSEFRTTTLTKVTELWNAANQKVAAGLVKVGVSANVASVAAKAFTASMTLGLSVAISAAIAGINKLITKYNETHKTAEEFAKLQKNFFDDYARSVASSAANIIAKFEKLKEEYESLGDSLEAKEKLIQDNKNAFKDLGAEINTVNDLENLFVQNEEAFKKSVMMKAKAAAGMALAADIYEESIKKMVQAENLDIESRDEKTRWGKTKTTFSAKGLTDEQNEKLNDIINNEIYKLSVANNQALAAGATFDQVMSPEQIKEAGIKAGEAYIEGIRTELKKEQDELDEDAMKIIKKAAEWKEGSFKALSDAGITPSNEATYNNDRNLALSSISLKTGRDKELKATDQWLKDELESIRATKEQIKESLGDLDADTLKKFEEREENARKEALKRRHDINKKYDDEIKDQNENLAESIKKEARNRKRLQEDNENMAEEARINAMSEGYDKTVAARNLSHKKELQQLERQKEDYIEQVVAEEKAVFKAREEAKLRNAQGEGRSYEMQRFDIDKARAGVDTSDFDAAIKVTIDKQVNYTEINLNQLLDKYASYEDKKQQLLIAYLEESDVLQAEYERTGDERFKRSLEERHKAYQQALASLEQEFNTTDFQLIFGDHAKQSMETLAKAAELIKKKIKELGDNANPETVKALYDELNEIENLQISNPFEGWDASMMGVIKQLYQIRNLEDEITKLNNQGQKKEADAVKGKLEKSQSDLAKSLAATGASEFASALSSAADSMKQIAEITGDVQLGETAEVLSGIAQNFSAAAQGAASGGWIGAIVGGVTDAIGQISNYLVELKIEEERSKAALRSFAEEIERMKFKLNEDDFSGIFGEKTLAKAKEAYKLYTEAWDAYYNGDYNAYQYTKYKGFLSWGHSWNPIDVNSLGQTTVQMKKNGKKLKSLAEIYPEIFNEDGSLNLAAAEAALANYAGIADGEFDTAYKALEGAVELQKQINENSEILDGIIGEYTQEMATNLSESIFDSILTGADAWDTFKQKGSQTILALGKQMLTELIMSQILEDDTKQYQKRLREALGRGDTEAFSEIYVEMMNDLHKNMEMGIEAAQNWIDDMKEQGFDMSAISGQTASAKGFQAMSQDTGDELNGRFTDIQGKVTDIRDYVLLVLQRNDATLNETLNIRDIMIQMNGNVADIRTYTSVLPEMRDTMERMNRKLDEI